MQQLRSTTDFFDEEVIITNSKDEKITIKRIERITELYIKNGFEFNVTSWGVITAVDNLLLNPYGVFGLTQDEAIELMSYESFILGIEFVINPENKELWYKENIFDFIETEINKKRRSITIVNEGYDNEKV